jgi:hypothetical protein
MSKHMNIDELRRQINRGELKISGSASCIGSGNLIDNEGKFVEYEINHGCDIFSANSCDRQWNLFNTETGVTGFGFF